MLRRQFLASMWSARSLPASTPRPNIVLILADDLGWGDVGMNGCPDIATPHIDSIALQGVRFSNFYANAPECTPTRCALLTGRYQQRIGGLECAIGVNNLGRYDEAEWLQQRGELGLPATQPTLAHLLRGQGYSTACIGKWHLGYMGKFGPRQHGFDRYFGILGGNADYFTHQEMGEGAGTSQLYDGESPARRPGYLTDLFTSEAVSWLRARKSNPFFLYLPFNAPHTPIQDPDEFDPSTGTAPHRNRQRSVYAKMVSRLDRSVGAVLRQLDAMGAAHNTLLLFLSDNGADPNGRNLPYRGLKSTVWEGGIRVPCALRWPARLKPNTTTAQTAATMDLLPTILSAAGLRPPAGNPPDGIDLLPLLASPTPPQPRTLFWRYKRAAIRRKAVRHGDWKYVQDGDKQYLFDLEQDPFEQRDLLPGNPKLAQELVSRLAAWEHEVRAPRLDGFVPAA